MNYSNKIYSVLLFLFMLVACKEEYVVTPATYSLLLTGENSKTWQQTSFTFIFNDTEVGEYDANLIYGIPDCALDDEYVFLRDGKLLEVYEGNDKCNPDEDDLLYKTSWDIVNANATLFFLLVAIIFPFGVGSDVEILREIGVGVIWVSAVFSSMFGINSIFQEVVFDE